MTPGPIDFNSVNSSAMQPKNGVQTSEMQKNNPGGIFKEAKDTGHNPKDVTGDANSSYEGTVSYTDTVSVIDYENGLAIAARTLPYSGTSTVTVEVTDDENISYKGTVPDTNTVSVEDPYLGTSTETVDGKDPVTQFKKLDKDGDLKISAREYSDNIIEDYVSNGHQYPSKYDNVAEFINDKYKEFKKFAGKDDSMNIDEFTNMLMSRLKTE